MAIFAGQPPDYRLARPCAVRNRNCSAWIASRLLQLPYGGDFCGQALPSALESRPVVLQGLVCVLASVAACRASSSVRRSIWRWACVISSARSVAAGRRGAGGRFGPRFLLRCFRAKPRSRSGGRTSRACHRRPSAARSWEVRVALPQLLTAEWLTPTSLPPAARLTLTAGKTNHYGMDGDSPGLDSGEQRHPHHHPQRPVLRRRPRRHHRRDRRHGPPADEQSRRRGRPAPPGHHQAHNGPGLRRIRQPA